METIIAFMRLELHAAYKRLLQLPCQTSGIILKMHSIGNSPGPRMQQHSQGSTREPAVSSGAQRCIFG